MNEDDYLKVGHSDSPQSGPKVSFVHAFCINCIKSFIVNISMYNCGLLIDYSVSFIITEGAPNCLIHSLTTSSKVRCLRSSD